MICVVPLVFEVVVREAFVELPWSEADTLRAELRLTDAASALLMAERPEVMALTEVEGVPLVFVGAPPPAPWDWSLRCVLTLSDRSTEEVGPIESLLRT